MIDLSIAMGLLLLVARQIKVEEKSNKNKKQKWIFLDNIKNHLMIDVNM